MISACERGKKDFCGCQVVDQLTEWAKSPNAASWDLEASFFMLRVETRQAFGTFYVFLVRPKRIICPLYFSGSLEGQPTESLGMSGHAWLQVWVWCLAHGYIDRALSLIVGKASRRLPRPGKVNKMHVQGFDRRNVRCSPAQKRMVHKATNDVTMI